MIFGFTLLSVAIWLPIIFGVLVLASAPVLSTTLARIDALFVMFCLTQPIIAILRKWRRSIQTIQVLILVLFSQNSMAVGSVLPVQTTTTPISGYVTQWSNTPVYTTQTESCIASTAALNAAYATPPYFLDSANPYYLSYCHILLPANSGYSGYLANIYVLSAAGCPADATLNGSNQCVSYTCPVNSQKNATPPTACICDANFQPDSTGKSCVPVQEEIFTLSLTPETTTTEPWHKKHDLEHLKANLLYKAIVKDQNGQLKAGINVTINTDVTSDSGGHVHTNGRPKGKLVDGTGASTKAGKETITGKTNGSGIFEFTFGAEEASGTHTLTAKCDSSCQAPATATVNAKVDGLELIPDGAAFYTLIDTDGAVIGSTSDHKNNHYLTPDASTILLYMASSYHAEVKYWMKPSNGKKAVPPLPLYLNDASLVWGGVFDINGDWKVDHIEHRRGTVIDIRANSKTGAIPSNNFIKFIKLAKYYGAHAKIHSPSSGNQHFHVRLLNREE